MSINMSKLIEYTLRLNPKLWTLSDNDVSKLIICNKYTTMYSMFIVGEVLHVCEPKIYEILYFLLNFALKIKTSLKNKIY